MITHEWNFTRKTAVFLISSHSCELFSVEEVDSQKISFHHCKQWCSETVCQLLWQHQENILKLRIDKEYLYKYELQEKRKRESKYIKRLLTNKHQRREWKKSRSDKIQLWSQFLKTISSFNLNNKIFIYIHSETNLKTSLRIVIKQTAKDVNVFVINFFLLMKALNDSSCLISHNIAVTVSFNVINSSFSESLSFLKKLNKSEDILILDALHFILYNIESLISFQKWYCLVIKLRYFNLFDMWRSHQFLHKQYFEFIIDLISTSSILWFILKNLMIHLDQ